MRIFTRFPGGECAYSPGCEFDLGGAVAADEPCVTDEARANIAARGSYCSAVAAGLRRRYSLADEALGFLDMFAPGKATRVSWNRHL
jgi:hypothetical protein